MGAWVERENALEKVFQFDSFRTAVDFVNQIAKEAEASNHHPDIHLSYKTVTVTLTSHDTGGITDLDRSLAKVIDRLV